MNTDTSFLQQADIRSYAIWLVSIVLVAFGFRYVKQLISVVLEELYRIFIQHGNAA